MSVSPLLDRREFLVGVTAYAFTPIACRRSAALTSDASGSEGGLGTTRGSNAACSEGHLRTTNAAGRSGAYYACDDHGGPRPLLVFTHGTGGSGAAGVATLRGAAEVHRFHVVAPDSRISPQGQATWEVGDHPNEVTPDFTHVLACIDEFLAVRGVLVDRTRVLIAGHSGGASMAPYIATNDERFSAFAILHGGVFIEGLGSHVVRGWISTGEADSMRSPAEIEGHASALRAAGYDVTKTIIPGDHAVSATEVDALLAWWLG